MGLGSHSDHPAATRADGGGSAGAAILAEGLGRSFGSVRALDSFDMSVPPGRVVALVGPNGAGKTTLLLILAGLLGADSGRVRVAGADPAAEPFEVRRSVGWMPDFFGVYDGLTSREYLELFAAAYRVPATERAPRSRELLALVSLEELADVQINTLSRGQKQRLGFARAIVHGPSVLLLDEPAAGLDPRARVELRELVRRQRDAGACVIVSSHILSELEEMSDQAVFVEHGRSTGEYTIAAGTAEAPTRPWRLRALDFDRLSGALTRGGVPFEVAGEAGVVVELAGEEAAAELLARLVGEGVGISHLGPESGGLERAFLASGGGSAR